MVERLASMRGDPRSILAKSKIFLNLAGIWGLLSSSTSSQKIYSTCIPWIMVKNGFKSRIGGTLGGTMPKLKVGLKSRICGAWLKLKVGLKSRIGGAWSKLKVGL